jgi:4-amino-4-deoxy-L-arabinose transferase-like glycosyltransferase
MTAMSSFGPLSGPADQPAPSSPPTLDYQTTGASTASVGRPAVPWLTNRILKHRRLLFACSLIPLLISFNGRWRMGLDSSIYRGLAQSIAAGNGYHFGEFGSHQIYPGLPVILAGFDKLFGENIYRPLGPLIFTMLCSLLTLILVYRLIQRHYPKWMAVSVTCCVACNSWFVNLSNEVLTDIPFLMGLVASLLGWDLLQAAQDKKSRWKSAALMIAGLALAALMRPTFWILCLALVCAWVWGLMRGLISGGWKLYAICLAIIVVLCLGFWAIDPRTHGSFHPLSGGYEMEMIEALQDEGAHGFSQFLLHRLPASFLGQQLPEAVGAVFSIVLLGSSLLLARKQFIWTILIILTVLVTLMLSTAPRYYVMVLPFLALGWLVMVRGVAEWFGGKWCDMIFLVGFGFVIGMNLAKIAPFVIEQERVPFWEPGMRFYDHYRGGKFLPVIKLSQIVKDNVPPGVKVITPSAQIVRYLTGREVMMERELISSKKNVRLYPALLAREGIRFAAFPARFYDKEPMLAQLMRHGVIVPGHRVDTIGDMRFSYASIFIPPGDWQKFDPAVTPVTRPVVIKTKPTTRPTTHPTTAKLKATAKRRAELKSAQKRQRKHAATTQPSSKKKHKHPTTRPLPSPTTSAPAP